MGKYHEISSGLELAVLEKDADALLTMIEEMLASLGEITSFRKSPLYEHMAFKEVNEEFLKELKENLLKCFRDREKFKFLKDDKRWQELVGAERI